MGMVEKCPHVVIHMVIVEGRGTRARNRSDHQVRMPTKRYRNKNQRTALATRHNGKDNGKPCFLAVDEIFVILYELRSEDCDYVARVRSNWLMNTGMIARHGVWWLIKTARTIQQKERELN